MTNDNDVGKRIGEAVLIAALSATITHLIAWGFEKIKGEKKEKKDP